MKKGIVDKVREADQEEAKRLVKNAKRWKYISPKTVRKIERVLASKK